MTKAVIHAGICGFMTRVEAEAPDEQNVTFAITSDCKNIKQLAEKLAPVDAYAEVGAAWDGVIHPTAEATLRGCCSGCVVPSGIFKTMQVAASIALPQNASIQIEKV